MCLELRNKIIRFQSFKDPSHRCYGELDRMGQTARSRVLETIVAKLTKGRGTAEMFALDLGWTRLPERLTSLCSSSQWDPQTVTNSLQACFLSWPIRTRTHGWLSTHPASSLILSLKLSRIPTADTSPLNRPAGPAGVLPRARPHKSGTPGEAGGILFYEDLLIS